MVSMSFRSRLRLLNLFRRPRLLLYHTPTPTPTPRLNVQLIGTADKNTIEVGEIVRVTISLHNVGSVEALNLEFGAKPNNIYLKHLGVERVPSGISEFVGHGASIQFAFDVRGKTEGRGAIGGRVICHNSQDNRYDFLNEEAVVIQVTIQ